MGRRTKSLFWMIDRRLASYNLATLAPWMVVLFIFAFRLPFFGHAHIHIDETYYLVFADRWRNGATPYIDIWDRKPIGLFLIYRLAFLFGDNGIIGYQLLALGAVILTALLLMDIQRRSPSSAGSWSGLFYGAGLMVLQGNGGQATIFSNLLVVAAARQLIIVWQTPNAPHLRLFAAMLLLGMALQIHSVTVFPACMFGTIALVLLWQRGHSWKLLVVTAVGFGLVGLLPTALAAVGFWYAGVFNPYFEATYLTIFRKLSHSADAGAIHHIVKAVGACALLLPLWVLAAKRTVNWILLAWLASAFAGGLILKMPAEHYLQPALPPLCLLAAVGLRRAWPAIAATLLMVATGSIATTIAAYKGGGFYLPYQIAKAIRPQLRGGCLFVVDSLPVLYTLTPACASSRFQFPTHLLEPSEMVSLGIDSRAELLRLFASRPAVVVMSQPWRSYISIDRRHLIEAALKRDYVLKERYAYPNGHYHLYALRPNVEYRP
jgi:hypothetical protein